MHPLMLTQSSSWRVLNGTNFSKKLTLALRDLILTHDLYQEKTKCRLSDLLWAYLILSTRSFGRDKHGKQGDKLFLFQEIVKVHMGFMNSHFLSRHLMPSSVEPAPGHEQEALLVPLADLINHNKHANVYWVLFFVFVTI